MSTAPDKPKKEKSPAAAEAAGQGAASTAAASPPGAAPAEDAEEQNVRRVPHLDRRPGKLTGMSQVPDDDSAYGDDHDSTASLSSSILNYRVRHGRTFAAKGEYQYGAFQGTRSRRRGAFPVSDPWPARQTTTSRITVWISGRCRLPTRRRRRGQGLRQPAATTWWSSPLTTSCSSRRSTIPRRSSTSAPGPAYGRCETLHGACSGGDAKSAAETSPIGTKPPR